jgi:hypothetical protein
MPNRIPRPGAPANPPQHILDETRLPPGGDTDHTRWKHRQTGEGTAATNDVADPHPSDEEHPYRAENPGGRRPAGGRDTRRAGDTHPNSHAHDGTPPPRPRNAENS